MKPVLWVVGKDPGAEMREAGAQIASQMRVPASSRSLGWVVATLLGLMALAMGALLVVLAEGVR